MIGFPRFLCVFFLVGLALAGFYSQNAFAQFDIIFNVPPDADPGIIRSNTQLNLFDGGELRNGFRAGHPNGGDENIEVNMTGGVVGVGSSANDGSTFNISGGTIEFFFDANFGSTVNISGGAIRNVFQANSGSEVNISGGTGFFAFQSFGSLTNITGGTLGDSFEAFAGSVINISGGSIGNFFGAQSNSEINIRGGSIASNFDAGSFNGGSENVVVNISGGSIGPYLQAWRGSTVNMSGGSLADEIFALDGSVMNLSGGEVGNEFKATSGSTINLAGGQFQLVDFDTGDLILDLTPLLEIGVPFAIEERDVLLTGIYVDGTEFSFDLLSTNMSDRDFFSTDAMLTVTLAVPEPNVAGFICLASLFWIGKRRARS